MVSVCLGVINKPLAQLVQFVMELFVSLAVLPIMIVSTELFAVLDSVNWVADLRLIV
jgi:hypothetical protein